MRNQGNILIFHDKADIKFSYANTLNVLGYNIFEAKDSESALSLISEIEIPIVLCDQIYKERNNGVDFLNRAKSVFPETCIIMVNHNSDPDIADEYMRSGAINCYNGTSETDYLSEIVARSFKRRDELLKEKFQRENSTKDQTGSQPGNLNPVLKFDAEGNILYANAVAISLLGDEWLAGNKVDVRLREHIEDTRTTGLHRFVEVEGINRTLSFVISTTAESEFVYAYGHDITEQKRSEIELSFLRNQTEKLALYDRLTGLANRFYFDERLNAAVMNAQRNDEKLGLLIVEFDNLKEINGNLGYKIGDEVLQGLSNHLLSITRDIDTCCRWSGDEIAIVLNTVGNRPRNVYERIRESLNEHIVKNEYARNITLSMGAAIYPDDADNQEMLIHSANLALHEAKGKIGGSIIEYSELENIKPIYQRQFTSGNLLNAIQNDEIEVFYQPIVDNSLHTVIAVEALARWNHPEHGFISPSVFIPIAEQSDLISVLSLKLFKKLIEDIKNLHDQGFKIDLSFNISRRQFGELNFVEKFNQTLIDHSFSKDQLIIEVTETSNYWNSSVAREQLQALAEAGFNLAADDFGVGYSSLLQLYEMPFNELKIDRAFVNNIDSEKGLSMLESIVSMAKKLDMTIVAEGVEDEEKEAVLYRLGVYLIQGYLYSQPLPIDQLTDYIRGFSQRNS
jgi:diguanylate cyclase (GGDEF)-like protein